MFTGLVEGTGRIAQANLSAESGGSIRVAPLPWSEPCSLGESIAVNGACLTVARVVEGGFEADVSQETLARTNLSTLQSGSLVNLERPLRVGDRLGGHWVLGHVDGVGAMRSALNEGEFWRLTFSLPKSLLRYVVEKGSIAVDGISLTVASLDADGFSVAIIPKTWDSTNLHARNVGDAVNLEVDILAKHVERFLIHTPDREGGISEEFLKEKGFL